MVILPVMSVLFLTAGMSVSIQKRFERMLPLVLLSISLALYLFGLISFVSAGVYFVAAASAAAFLHLVWRRLHGEWKKIRQYVFTPGAALFVAFAIFAYVVSRNRLIIEGDSFSYWGAAVKTMYYNNVLGNTAGVFMLYPHYPPVGILTGYFFVRFLPSFQESAVIYGKMLLTFSLLVPLMRNTSWREPGRCLVYGALVFFAPYFFSIGGSDSVFTDLRVDGLLGLLLANTLLCYFAADKADAPLFTAGGLAIFAAATCLTKPSGIGLCLMILAVIGADYLLFERKKRTKFPVLADHTKLRRWSLAIPVLAVVAAYVSWQIFIAIELPAVVRHGRYDGNAVSVILDAMRQPFSESQITCIKNMVLRFTTMNATGAAFDAPVVMVLLAFGFLAIQVFIAEKKQDGKRMVVHTVLLFGCIALYVISMLITYLFYMNNIEMATLASWDRYIGMIFLGVGIYLLFRWLLQPGVRLRTAYVVLAAAVLAALPVVAAQHSAQLTQIEREPYQALATAAVQMNPEKDKVYIVKETILTDSVVRYICMPVGTEEDPFICEDELETTSVRQFESMLGDCSYLYIWSQNEAFAKKYAALFAETPETYHLYRIERTQNGDVILHDAAGAALMIQ